MYQPQFNSVLVEIDDAAAAWGSGNDENMLGASYSKGKVIKVGELFTTEGHPIQTENVAEIWQIISSIVDQNIMWNEGTEAGTTFEHDGKLYGFIYWWDIRGVKVDNGK